MIANYSKNMHLLKLLVLLIFASLNQNSFINTNLIDDNLCSHHESKNEEEKCDFKCLTDRDSSSVEYYFIAISLFDYFSSFIFIFTKISSSIEENANSPPKNYLFNL